jgi:hypothetical protein
MRGMGRLTYAAAEKMRPTTQRVGRYNRNTNPAAAR